MLSKKFVCLFCLLCTEMGSTWTPVNALGLLNAASLWERKGNLYTDKEAIEV